MPTPIGVDPDRYEIYIPPGDAPPAAAEPTDQQPVVADQPASESPDQPAAQPVAQQPVPADQQQVPQQAGNAPVAGLPGGQVFVAQDGPWHYVPDPETFNALGLDWNAISWYGELPGSIGEPLPSLKPAPATTEASPASRQPAPVESPLPAAGTGSLAGLPDGSVYIAGDDGLWHLNCFRCSESSVFSPADAAQLLRRLPAAASDYIAEP
jgi:hypothetical protein